MKFYDWFVDHIDEIDVFENVSDSEINACQPDGSYDGSYDATFGILSADRAPLRLRNAMLETIKGRKQAQKTVVGLKNRLHYLRSEEAKTLQRVQLLRQCTQELEGKQKFKGMVKELREQIQGRQNGMLSLTLKSIETITLTSRESDLFQGNTKEKLCHSRHASNVID